MRVLVTGAAGTLGQVLLPRLLTAGHEAVALDIRRGSADAAWVVADLRDSDAVRTAMDRVDLVVHTAALHGIHLAGHSPRAFYELNLTGTFNVWQAALDAGVRGVVFSSTMGVYGESRRPTNDTEVVFLHEEVPLRPGDIYGWTKVAGEELCRYHVREHGISSIALRFGMFVPEPSFRYGIRLLYGGVHEEDVAGAVMAAVGRLAAGGTGHEVYNVEAPLPFTPDDGPDLRRDPLVALERHFPGSADLLRSRGVVSLKPVTEIFPVERLRRDLGYRSLHDFGTWLQELRETDERSDADQPWP